MNKEELVEVVRKVIGFHLNLFMRVQVSYESSQ